MARQANTLQTQQREHAPPSPPSPPSTKVGSVLEDFITMTAPEAAKQRGEEILGVPRRPAGDIWTTTVRVKPSQAKRILLAMPVQRPMEPGNVAFFVNLINEGEFTLTHQGLAFDKSGKLFDGQHRLQACVDSGQPIEIMATFNCNRRMFHAIDRGRVRTAGDDLICEGVVTSRVPSYIMGAAAKIVWHLEAGRVPYAPIPRGQFPASKMLRVLHDHPQINKAVQFCLHKQHALRGIGPGSFSGFLTRFLEINPDRAMAFAERVIAGSMPDGSGLRAGDPVMALREYTRLTPGARYKLVRASAMVAIVRCWNAEIQGRSLARVNGALREGTDFPKILSE